MTEQELKKWKAKNPKSTAKTTPCWPGKAAMTYMAQKNWERKMKRSIDKDTFARPLAWGKLVEGLLFDLLGTEYSLTSTDTTLHPIIPWWAGSKDGLKHDEGRTVIDMKCPWTLESFCKLVEPLYNGLTGIDAINALLNGFTDKMGVEHSAHDSADDYYWQLVSNACIENTKYAELVIYCPFYTELEAIKFKALQTQASDNLWLSMAANDELPFIPEGSMYNNINIIRFEVPEADKQLLTQRVLQAGKYLIDEETGTNALEAFMVASKNNMVSELYEKYQLLIAA